MVDIPRGEEVKRRKRIRQSIYAISAITVIILITVGVSRLKPAAPTVDRATVWIDTVKQGPMVRQVRGSGTLVPEDIRWIPANTQGRVERIVLRAGATVSPESVILELSNPELEQTVLSDQANLRAAQANLASREADLESALLNQRAAAARVEQEYRQAALQLEANEELYKDKLISELQLKQSRGEAQELKNRWEIEQKRTEIAAENIQAQLAPQQAEVDRLRTMFELHRRQLDQLKVRAGMAGVLQVVPVEVGQQVQPGANLARVANPRTLKAELRIPETQTRDLAIGQLASIDTRNGIVEGRVSRIDPAAQNGTVGVDVSLTGPLPPGARPDLSVDGTVELERLNNVVYVGRPAFGQENSSVGLFRLSESGEAVRITVQLGRSSVNTIEIVNGLRPGEQVILSDMSAWDQYERIRLN
ncbi:MAG TPA: HlyD family efflux transporter periplasmic adaptor subunit [Vicinamibacterales bacterium]|nr:HlyD family efflux transporter periplasmic adaptor subunit [Vicinamibacterales bacterium]